MDMKIIFFLFLAVYQVDLGSAESLLERLYASAREPSFKKYKIYDAELDHHLTVPRHHMLEVARFRGKPILARQLNTVIDEDGVAIPLLPYDGRTSSIGNQIHRLAFHNF